MVLTEIVDNQIDTEGLHGKVAESVEDFTQKIANISGDNLISLSVVGNCLTEEYEPQKSHIRTIVVLKSIKRSILDYIAGMSQVLSRRNLSTPLLISPCNIEKSLEALGLDFLDFGLSYKTVYGPDPFGDLDFSAECVRSQCERELKVMLLKLRQGYISSGGKRGLVRDLLVEAVSGLAPVIRGMFWLKGVDRCPTGSETFTRSSVEFLIEAESLKEVYLWRNRKIKGSDGDIGEMYDRVYKAVAKLATALDELEVLSS